MNKKEQNNLRVTMTRLLKTGPDRLYSDGKGTISNGHWLIELSPEILGNLPESVRLKGGKAPLDFPLHKPAENWFGELKTDGRENLPAFDRVTEAFDEDRTVASFDRFHAGIGMALLEGSYTNQSCYVVKNCSDDAKPVAIKAEYVDNVFALMGTDIHGEWPEILLDKYDPELSSVVFKSKSVQAIIMPVRM